MTQDNDPETYAILGAAMQVHSELGRGFLESVNQDAFEKELSLQKIPFQREVKMTVCYRGVELPSYFVADFVCYTNIIVELKAMTEMAGAEKAQVLNYLKVSGFKRGLLLNFGKERLDYERIANFFKKSGNHSTDVTDDND